MFMGKQPYTCQYCGEPTDAKRGHRECRRPDMEARERAREQARKNLNHVRERLVRKRGSKCERCGVPGYVEMHHKVGLRDHGPTTEDNLILLCSRCHATQTHDDQIVDAWIRKGASTF